MTCGKVCIKINIILSSAGITPEKRTTTATVQRVVGLTADFD
jgi:hypothetical protein